MHTTRVVYLAALTTTGACWSQPSTLGLPCSSDNECDDGQRCVDERCRDSAGTDSAGTDSASNTGTTNATTTGVDASTSDGGTSTSTSTTDDTTGTELECESIDCAPTPDWSLAFGDDEVRNYAMGVDGAGNVYVGGVYKGTLSVGGEQLPGGLARFRMYLLKFAPNGALLWANDFGDDLDYDALVDLAVTKDGLVYFTGSLTGPLTMCGEQLEGVPDDSDLFVARVNGFGECDRITRFVKPEMQSGEAIAYDEASQSLIVGGVYQGEFDLGQDAFPTELTGYLQLNGFYARFDLVNDEFQPGWSHGFGVAGAFDFVQALTPGPEQAAFLSASFSGEFTLGSDLHSSIGGSHDAVIARVSATNGDIAWSRSFLSAEGVTVTNLAYDAEGGLLIAGHYLAELESLGLPSAADGAADLFVVRMDASTGELLWKKSFNDPSRDDLIRGIAIDPINGHALLSTRCFATSSYGGGPLEIEGEDDACLVRLDLDDGDFLWNARFGGAKAGQPEFGRQLALDLSGEAALLWSGDFFGSADFGGPALDASGDHARTFLARFFL